MSDKTYTADELRTSKAEAFLAAYSGQAVRITNVRFPGGHFELRFVNVDSSNKLPYPREAVVNLLNRLGLVWVDDLGVNTIPGMIPDDNIFELMQIMVEAGRARMYKISAKDGSLIDE